MNVFLLSCETFADGFINNTVPRRPRTSCNAIFIISSFYGLTFQGRRTSERFIKPAIPSQSVGLNTSAPNILSHQHHGILGSSSGPSHHLPGNSHSPNTSAVGSNPNSLNSSLSSTSNTTLPPNVNISNSNISFGAHTSFTQPASPMDTSVCKD